MTEIPVDESLVQLNGFTASEKQNKLVLLCEKRQNLKLIKYMRILNLDNDFT